jgi:hypothetical protein
MANKNGFTAAFLNLLGVRTCASRKGRAYRAPHRLPEVQWELFRRQNFRMELSSFHFADAALIDAQGACNLVLIDTLTKQAFDNGRNFRAHPDTWYALHILSFRQSDEAALDCSE